jgi:hypothetical protein
MARPRYLVPLNNAFDITAGVVRDERLGFGVHVALALSDGSISSAQLRRIEFHDAKVTTSSSISRLGEAGETAFVTDREGHCVTELR